MNARLVLTLIVLLPLSRASAGPPVTSPAAPSPRPAQAARWLEALLQAPLLELCDDRFPRSEAARMLVTVQHGRKLGPGQGWYDPSRVRHDWSWLAGQFDADRDGAVARREWPADGDSFARLDRDGDGVIGAADLDWSERSAWVRQDAEALKLLRAIDGDGDGRLTEQEWQAFFRKRAGQRGQLGHEDLRELLSGPANRVRKVSDQVWLRSLLDGDLGSPFEGPRVGQAAPDFTLPTHKGKQTVTLSDFRGQKPVVLIFGSFT